MLWSHIRLVELEEVFPTATPVAMISTTPRSAGLPHHHDLIDPERRYSP